MSKEEIVSAIQSCARKLGRVPTRRELQKMNGVSHHEVDRRFGSYGRAVTLAGLKPERKHHEGIAREALLTDWARVARKLGKAPTRFEYIAEGAYSTTPFERHWKRWPQVAQDFMRFAKEPGQEGLWEDAIEIAKNAKKHPSPQICADRTDRKRAGNEKSSFGCASGFRLRVQTITAPHEARVGDPDETPAERLNLPLINTDDTDQKRAGSSIQHPRLAGAGSAFSTQPGEPENPAAGDADQEIGIDGFAGLKASATQQSSAVEHGGWWRKRRVLRDRPVYGAPAVHAGALGHVPMNEVGVLVAFGMVAERLGLVVLRVQTEFPDCEVLCEMEPGRWQRLRVEFEFESRNFLRHGHDVNGCDMIVCWRHNWPECPESIEVVELGRMVMGE